MRQCGSEQHGLSVAACQVEVCGRYGGSVGGVGGSEGGVGVQVLARFIKRPEVAEFVSPVPADVEGYYQVIQHPVDLGIILTRLRAHYLSYGAYSISGRTERRPLLPSLSTSISRPCRSLPIFPSHGHSRVATCFVLFQSPARLSSWLAGPRICQLSMCCLSCLQKGCSDHSHVLVCMAVPTTMTPVVPHA